MRSLFGDGENQSRLYDHQVAGQGRYHRRRVNVGQTVVAAMNAASLFLLAKDLQRMPDLGFGQ